MLLRFTILNPREQRCALARVRCNTRTRASLIRPKNLLKNNTGHALRTLYFYVVLHFTVSCGYGSEYTASPRHHRLRRPP